jgi:hypothetical protein
MTIHRFASKHHLNVTRAEDGTSVVKGRNGEIYEYGDEETGRAHHAKVGTPGAVLGARL